MKLFTSILSFICFIINSERATFVVKYNRNRSLVILLFVIFFSGIIYSQAGKSQVDFSLTSFGLENKTITSLAMEYPNQYTVQNTENFPLLAGTEGEGVFLGHPFSSNSGWNTYGLQRKNIAALTVQHWGIGPLDGLKVIAGITNENPSVDSALIFEREILIGTDTTWTPSDSGLNRESLHQISALSSYYYTGETPPQPVILGVDTALYYGPGFWSHAIYQGSIKINSIDVNPHWYGELACAAGRIGLSPAVFISKDKGINWDAEILPSLIEGESYSVAINPDQPDTIYAGGLGFIWVTTDGGNVWNTTSLESPGTKITALAVDPVWTNIVYAGGVHADNSFAFFFSKDAGQNWTDVSATITEILAGVSSIAVAHIGVGTDSSRTYAFIGTLGTGVWMFSTDNITSVENPESSPESFQLYQNYPNPFNPTTKIKYRIANRGFVSLKVYDVLGNEVSTLVDEEKPAGNYEVEFNASKLTSGVYFYRIQAEGFTATKKLIIIR